MDNDNIKKPGAGRKPLGGKKPIRKALPDAPEDRAHEGERIAKVMARAGLCSRRDAEIWIGEGRVAVNGTVLTSAALNVTADDKVTVDGKPLATRERTRLFLFHKPRGLVTTDRDPEGRPTLFDYVAEKFPALPRLMSIGRLDINTEGLLLLTNDGGLARVLELPATGWLRRYRARANGVTDQARLDTLSQGVTLDGVDYAGVEARLDRTQGANVWISLGLREGKNREVKRLLEHLGLAVNRLIRLSYGPFQLGEMEEGGIEEVRTRVLADQLGESLSQQANVDFEGPVFDRTPEPEPERTYQRGDGPRGRRTEERGEKPAKKSFASQEKPEPRKHVTALRSDRVKAEQGPRRRTERDATEDRRGRKVVVERVSAARPKEAAPATRNARRFKEEREQQDDRPKTFAPGRKSGPRTERPAGETGAAKSFRRDAAPREDRSGGNGERPRGRSQSFGDKPTGDKTFRPRGEGRSFGDKPSGGKEFRPRGEGRGFGDKPAGEKTFRPRGEGRSFGDKPAGEKSFRPRGEKPAGKSFGDRPKGDRPSGGKSFGGKSSGGKPFSDKSSGPKKPRGK